MLSYIDTETAWTRFFKCRLRENGLSRRFPSYRVQYRVMRHFLQQMHPFMWVKPGQQAVQCGCTEWMLDFGVSQAMTLSALVGPTGKVLVIDPDERNIETLSRYMHKHGVNNIEVVQQAVWKEKTVANFTFYADRTSSNVISEVQDRALWGASEAYTERPQEVREIQLDTIDNIAADRGFEPDFVNLTINDAELEGIMGLERAIERGVTVSWLFGGDRNWWADSIQFFADRDYDVVAGNAPYTHRGPGVNGKIRFYKYREVPQEFYGVAMRAAGRTPHPKERPAKLAKVPDGKDFQVTFTD